MDLAHRLQILVESSNRSTNTRLLPRAALYPQEAETSTIERHRRSHRPQDTSQHPHGHHPPTNHQRHPTPANPQHHTTPHPTPPPLPHPSTLSNPPHRTLPSPTIPQTSIPHRDKGPVRLHRSARRGNHSQSKRVRRGLWTRVTTTRKSNMRKRHESIVGTQERNFCTLANAVRSGTTTTISPQTRTNRGWINARENSLGRARLFPSMRMGPWKSTKTKR